MQIRRGTGLAIFWLAGSALGATYSYTRVVESSGSYFGQLYPPAVNNSGTVAFVSYAPGQGQGVFRSGESLVALTTSYSGYTFSKWLDISNNGDVIYRSGGYVFVNTNIVASGGSYDGDGVALNDAGQYVYPTNTAMIRSSIGDPSSSTVIGSRIGTDSQVPIRPSITPAGIISYSYTTLSGGYSYGVVSDGITKQNLFVGGPRDYASNVVDLTVNDSGQALYRGTRNVLGGTGLYYMEEFGQYPLVELLPGGSIVASCMNNSGQYAFVAEMYDGTQQLYAGSNGAMELLVSTGSLFQGQAITSIGLGPQGISDNGNVAFTVGSTYDSAIYVVAIPEPAALSMLAVAVYTVLGRRARSLGTSRMELTRAHTSLR